MAQNNRYLFNTGSLFGVTTDGTPYQFALLQSVSLNFNSNPVNLMGQNRYPELVAIGSGTIQCQAESASIDAQALNLMLAGAGTVSTGSKLMTTQSTSAATTVTVSGTTSANFYQDLGVLDVSNSLIRNTMTKVSASPSAGQYACSAGVYTFAAADANKAIQISYLYTDSAGSMIALTNTPMGVATTFKCILNSVLVSQSGSSQMTVQLNACVSNQLQISLALEKFDIPQFSFNAFADATNALGWMSIS